MAEGRQHEQAGAAAERERARLEALTRVEAALRNLKYGEVVVTVQGGKPILVETRKQERIG